MVKGVKRKSIYDKIGWTGLFNVVWNSMPYPLRGKCKSASIVKCALKGIHVF